MNAKEYLGQAYRLDQHINDRLMQLSQLRALTQRITTACDGEVVSRTRNVHALEDSVIRLMEAEESINEEIDRFVDIKMDISKTIARVRNENYRLILEKRYLCFMTWEQISLDMHYTNRWLRKMHERALDVVDRSLLERSGCPGATGKHSRTASRSGGRETAAPCITRHATSAESRHSHSTTCETANTPAGRARRRLRFEKSQEDRIVPLSSSEFPLMHT